MKDSSKFEQRWSFLYVNYNVVNYIAVYLNDQSRHFLEKNCIVKEKNHEKCIDFVKQVLVQNRLKV
jgi:hypothetical protein